MFKLKQKLLIILVFVAIGPALVPLKVSAANPAKCIIFDAGSQPTSDIDDTYALVDCEQSAYKDLRTFADGAYYNVGTVHFPPPVGDSTTVTELTKEQYDAQVEIIEQKNAAAGGNYDGDCKKDNLNKRNCGIIAYLVTFTRVLSGIVGVVIVIMIAVGGIQYSTARDNPQAVAAARGRIMNALLALVIYMFSFAFLQWLVPGGIL